MHPAIERGLIFQKSFFSRHPGAESVVGLFDHLPNVFFYAKDSEHRYVGMNQPTLSDVFGLSALEEILGRTDEEFQPPALAAAYHTEDRRVFDTGETIASQLWLVPHVRGTPKWYVSTKTPLFDADGQVIGLAGAMYPVATPQEEGAVFRELLPVIQHIDSHYTESISMKEMAEQAGVSATSFNTRFREILRMTPSEYVLSRALSMRGGSCCKPPSRLPTSPLNWDSRTKVTSPSASAASPASPPATTAAASVDGAIVG